MRITIIVPIFNEEHVIASVLERVRAVARPPRMEILLVNDGSTDGTGAILEDQASTVAGVQVIHHRLNRGKGAAIRSALARASGEIVLVQDADLEYSPEDYGRILAPFEDPAVQAVYGSRFLSHRWPANMRVASWIANKVFVAATNLLYGSALTDEGTAYKAVRRELLHSLEIASSRFEFCPELTAKLLRRGVRILEVPVSYSARRREDGKKPGFRDGLSVLWTLVRLRFTAAARAPAHGPA